MPVSVQALDFQTLLKVKILLLVIQDEECVGKMHSLGWGSSPSVYIPRYRQ